MVSPPPRVIVTAPDKGSFPLDHEGVCKIQMRQYMKCLHKNGRQNNKCRAEAMDYFQCRMDNNLMAKEDWSKLGFHDVPGKPETVKEPT